MREFSCFMQLKQGKYMPSPAATFAHIIIRTFLPNTRVSGPCRTRLTMGASVLCCLAIPQLTLAQTQSDTRASTAQSPQAQELPRVTTTVVVHGEVENDYLSDGMTAGSLDGTLLKETPLSVAVVTRAVLSD